MLFMALDRLLQTAVPVTIVTLSNSFKIVSPASNRLLGSVQSKAYGPCYSRGQYHSKVSVTFFPDYAT